MTKREFCAIAALLTGYYPHRFKADDEFILSVWFEELRDLDAKQVMAGIRQMARDAADEWPSIATIRKYADPQVTAGQVWSETVKAVLEHGPHGKWCSETRTTKLPTFEPRVKTALERIGGARAILEAPDAKSLQFLSRDFCQAITEMRSNPKLASSKQMPNAILAAPDEQEAASDVQNVVRGVARKLMA